MCLGNVGGRAGRRQQQVRARTELQQVVAAPNEAREELLKDLEDFAFRGIPNMRPPDMDNKTLCLVS